MQRTCVVRLLNKRYGIDKAFSATNISSTGNVDLLLNKVMNLDMRLQEQLCTDFMKELGRR